MRDAKTRILKNNQRRDTEEGDKEVKFHFQGAYTKYVMIQETSTKQII